MIHDQEKRFYVSHIDDTKQPEELLNLEAYFARLQSSCVVLEGMYRNTKIEHKIYNSKDIQQLRNLLQKGIPFKVVCANHGNPHKILEYKNDSYFWWNGWIPCFNWQTEITQLDQMGAPETLNIDLFENNKTHNSYKFRQSLLNSLFALISGALIIYLMGDHLKSFPLKIK